MLDTLTTLLQPWADYYAASGVLPTATIAMHLLAILGGGGIAIGTDRQVLRTTIADPQALLATADQLRGAHGVVIGSLAVIVVSGLALAAADLGTFSTQPVFWVKMAAFAGLLANGSVMRRTESRVLAMVQPVTDTPERPPAVTPAMTTAWNTLRRGAWGSLAGWFVIMLLGVLVANS
ncbi:MAG: hypothetical protein ACK6DP_12675 [Gemmatimonas sp.]|jgi:hypothetical protein|uniref:hypothetical protein n=1 Tax=Gemmatimonas sp. TaxID=1962908 RepID=UPI00391F20AD|nr:hypothetical protein [Gemmatimonadota bacterium]